MPALATSHWAYRQEVHQALLDMAGFAKTDDLPASRRTRENSRCRLGCCHQRMPIGSGLASTETVAVEAVLMHHRKLPDEVAPTRNAPNLIGAGRVWVRRVQESQQISIIARSLKGNARRKKPAPRPAKSEPVLATAGGAFAELAALKEAMKK